MDLTDYYVVYSQNRDSDVYVKANYKRILEDLEKVKQSIPEEEWLEFEKKTGLEPEDAFFDTRHSHWAVGWIEFIFVHKDAPEQLLREADRIASVLEDYPIYDEDYLSELEAEELAEYWENTQSRDLQNYAYDILYDLLEKNNVPSGESKAILNHFEKYMKEKADDFFYLMTEKDQEAYSRGYIKDEYIKEYADKAVNDFLEDEYDWVGYKKLKEHEEMMRKKTFKTSQEDQELVEELREEWEEVQKDDFIDEMWSAFEDAMNYRGMQDPDTEFYIENEEDFERLYMDKEGLETAFRDLLSLDPEAPYNGVFSDSAIRSLVKRYVEDFFSE